MRKLNANNRSRFEAWTVRKSILHSAIFLLGCGQNHDQNESGELKPPMATEGIGTRFLLLDSRITEKVENAKLVVGTVKKHNENPLFGEDKPWEKRFDNLYGNVIYDEEEKLYKCWYSPFVVDESANGMTLKERKERPYKAPENREMAICYATSEDGITWVKPEFDIVEYENTKANNILWRGKRDDGEHWGGPHGSGIFKDLLDADPDRRYKAILKGEILSVAFSADGIHWSPAIACPEADVPGDTHNNAFWAPTLGKYVGITREWGAYEVLVGQETKKDQWVTDTFIGDDQKNGRQVARIESADFVNWTKAEVVLEGTSLNRQTYAMPVFFYGGVYLGLLAIHEQSSDRVWTELTWSPDTKTWHRISPGTPLIPNSEKELEYDWGCVYACATPVFLEEEIRLYYGGSDWLHTDWRNAYLCLATLRPDGFAGYEQESKDQPATITTTAISYDGQQLQITADVEPGGVIQVSILDEGGKEISQAEAISATMTEGRLKISQPIKEDTIRLRFEISKAKLFSFNFGR